MFKKIFFVVLALVATLSLFVVSASADYVDGEFEPVVGTIDSFSAEVVNGGNVNFDGYTKIDLISFIHVEGNPMSGGRHDIAIFEDREAYVYVPAGVAGSTEGRFVRCSKLRWEQNTNEGSLLYVRPDVQSIGDTMTTGMYLLVPNYPFEIVEGSAPVWELIQFEAYTVGSESTDEPTENEDVGSVMSVWSLIMTWIVTALASVQAVFFVNGSLTFIGTLAVVGVSIGIGFLIIGVVQRFLKLRG